MSWLAQLFRRHRPQPAPTPEPRLVVLPPYSFQRQHAAPPPLPPPRPRRIALGTHGDAGPPPTPRPVAAPPPLPPAAFYGDDENTVVTVRPGVDMGELYPEGDTRG